MLKFLCVSPLGPGFGAAHRATYGVSPRWASIPDAFAPMGAAHYVCGVAGPTTGSFARERSALGVSSCVLAQGV